MTEADVERVAKIILECGNPMNIHEAEITARAAIAAMPPPADQWQPIETAPKDGDEIIGWEKSEGRFLCAWRPDLAGNTSYVWFSTKGEWAHCPTHWMPLPEPPK